MIAQFGVGLDLFCTQVNPTTAVTCDKPKSTQADDDDDEVQWTTIPGWSLLTEDARTTLKDAMVIAAQDSSRYIGSEHLLAAILSSRSKEAQILAGSLMVNRSNILEHIGRHRVAGIAGETAPAQLTALAKEVIGGAINAENAMNYGRVSLGHLALALIETKRGLAHQALSAAKIDLAFIHEALLSAVTVSTSA